MKAGARGKTVASVVAVVFLLASGWICYEALLVPFGSFRMPGAGFFPLLLGLSLALLSLGFLGTSLLSPGAGATAIWPERVEVLYLLASTVIAVAIFEPVGFLLTMGLFLLVSAKMLGQMRWMTSVVLAVIGSVTAHWVFGRLLQISLPTGLLPF